MSYIANKVKLLRLKKNETQEESAQKAGIPLITWQSVEQGKRIPRQKLVKKITEYFKISEAELYGETKTIQIKDVKIPVVSMAKGDDEEGFKFEDLEPHEYEYIDFSNCKAIKITTNSMAPIAYRGQKIIYCESLEVQDGDLVFVGLKSGEQYFKRLAKDGKSKYVTLEPINVIHYKSKTIKHDQIKFIYKVVGVKF